MCITTSQPLLLCAIHLALFRCLVDLLVHHKTKLDSNPRHTRNRVSLCWDKQVQLDERAYLKPGSSVTSTGAPLAAPPSHFCRMNLTSPPLVAAVFAAPSFMHPRTMDVVALTY